VEVLDGAAARLATSQENLATRLEAATVGVGMIDVTTAAAMSRRRDAVRRRAAADPAAPPEVLAVAAFTAALTNEPHTSAIALATRALSAGREALADRTDRPWYTNATWFSQTTVSLVVAEDYERVGPLLDDSIARARATADSGRFAVGLAHRGWVALRCGSLLEAAADTEAALAAAELPAPTFYRVLNASILVDCLVEQGELDEAQHALAPMNDAAESGSLTAVMLRFARGRLRIAQGRTADGLQDLLAAGAVTTRSLVSCPSFLPWRSEAAMAQLALGDDEAARRLAEEELVLARAFGAPKALGVALRAAGLARGGDAGEALLREAVVTLAETPARLDRARTLAELGALLRRRNRRREARAFLREALDIAHRAGARALTARAETELRATGARPRRVVLDGGGLAHRLRAPRRGAGGAGHDQPRDRPVAVRHRAHGGGPSHQRVSQAGPGLPRGHRRGHGPGGRTRALAASRRESQGGPHGAKPCPEGAPWRHHIHGADPERHQARTEWPGPPYARSEGSTHTGERLMHVVTHAREGPL
jgi:tetratricopeptide (TPR) repeat protein